VSEWQTKRLGDVLQLNYGKSLPLKSRVDGAIPVYGSNGIVGSHNYPIVDKPGLVVGRKGSAGEVHFSRRPFCPIDTTFYVTEDDAPDTDLEFLFYLLRHVDLRRITGDVGVPGLNREMAYMEPVRLPAALPEQKKIAHILSTVQRAIEAQERIIQTTTDLKKALMHKLFTEGLRNEPQKQTEIGPVPESWEVVFKPATFPIAMATSVPTRKRSTRVVLPSARCFPLAPFSSRSPPTSDSPGF
jgi:type I restriction enzyme S subunit